MKRNDTMTTRKEIETGRIACQLKQTAAERYADQRGDIDGYYRELQRFAD